MRTDLLNRVLKIAISLLAGALMAACGENIQDPETKSEITVDVSSLDIFTSGITVEAAPSGGVYSRQVLFFTTDQWTATLSGTEPLDWITIQPTSGSAGTASMRVSVVRNESESERTAEVTITCGEAKKSFRVMQEGKDLLSNVIVCSDTNENGIIVTELKDDGTLILSSDTKEKPKVGEIMVSGATEVAPHGFLYRVEKVEEQNGKIVVKTKEAYLDEVLPDSHLAIRIPSEDVTLSNSTRASIKRDKEIDLLDFTYGFDLTDEANPPKWFSDKASLKGSGTIELKTSCTFIYDSDNGIPQRCGLQFDGSLGFKLALEAALKEKLGPVNLPDFLDIDLMTATFWVGGVIPVSATFHLVADLEIEASGKAYFKWTPVDQKLFKFETHLIWTKEPNLLGEHWDRGCSNSTPFDDFSWQKAFENLLDGLNNYELGLQGEVKASFRPRLQARLYNNENIMVGIGVSPYAKLEGQLALKYELGKGAVGEAEVKDNLSLSIGADIPLEGKIKFKDYGAELPKPGEVCKLSLFEIPLVQGASFFPAFNDFGVHPEDDAKTYAAVHVSARRGDSALTWLADTEEDFGFCYAPIEKDAQGQELPRRWQYISLWDKYEAARLDKTKIQYIIETDIPTADLQTGMTYDVRPYTTVGLFRTIKRKGGTFKTGGAVGDGGGVIIDIPGEDL